MGPGSSLLDARSYLVRRFGVALVIEPIAAATDHAVQVFCPEGIDAVTRRQSCDKQAASLCGLRHRGYDATSIVGDGA